MLLFNMFKITFQTKGWLHKLNEMNIMKFARFYEIFPGSIEESH